MRQRTSSVLNTTTKTINTQYITAFAVANTIQKPRFRRRTRASDFSVHNDARKTIQKMT